MIWACSFLVVPKDFVAVQRCKSDSHCGTLVEKRCFSVRDRGEHWPFMSCQQFDFNYTNQSTFKDELAERRRGAAAEGRNEIYSLDGRRHCSLV